MLLNRFKKAALLSGDLLLLFAALYLTLLIRETGIPSREIWALNFRPFAYLFIFWTLVFYINGLYEITTSKNDIEFYNKIIRNLLINYVLGAAYFYFLTDKLFDIKPRGTYFLFLIVITILWGAWRYWFNAFVQRPSFLKKVLVVGMNDEAKELVEEILRKPQLGYKISAIMHGGFGNPKFPGVEIFDSSADLKKILRDKDISTVVTALNPHSNPELVKKLYESLSMRLQFFDLPSFYEKLTGKIPITTIGHIWFLENLKEGDQGFYEIFKRTW
jgi:FlaA1/EpsC-like NDP-sugar epimerase